jgi:hypothetical protein
MKDKNIYKKRLLLSGLALCVSFVTLITAVFGWFSLNDFPAIDGFSFFVYSNPISNITYNAYAVSAVALNGTLKQYTLASDNNNLIPLQNIPSFDFENITLNEYEPFLAVNVNFSLIRSIDLVLLALTEKDLITIDYQNWLSNCAEFVPADFNVENLSLTSDALPKSFVTIEQGQLSKINALEVFSGAFFAGNVSLWFVIGYKSDVLQIIHNENSVYSYEYISFLNDIKLEIKTV